MNDGSLAKAAVLVPVYLGPGGEIRIVLIRRSAYGIHGGQMAFPGGRPEPCDTSLLETALREAEEEIGLSPQSVTPIMQLPDVITQVSGFCITPFLARITPPPQWICDPDEVDCLVDVSLEDLVASHIIEDVPSSDPAHPTEYFLLGEDKVWGATYRILAPLVQPLRQREFEL